MQITKTMPFLLRRAFFMCCLSVLMGCQSSKPVLRNMTDTSIDYQPKINGHTNGTAYDLREISSEGVVTISVPYGTKISRTNCKLGVIQILLKKTVAIVDIPPSPAEASSITEIRKRLGCCYCIDQGVMTIVCIGNSRIIGAGTIETSLELCCPPSIQIIERLQTSPDETVFGWPTTIRSFSSSNDIALVQDICPSLCLSNGCPRCEKR